jgi:hypothetical protein
MDGFKETNGESTPAGGVRPLRREEFASAKIISARLSEKPRPLPEGFFDPMPGLFVTMENGEELGLFTFYPDEISMEPEEFVGLTVDEAFGLRHKKDVAYLRGE